MNAESLLDKLEAGNVAILSNESLIASMSEGMVQAATIKNEDGQAPTDNSVCQNLVAAVNPDIEVAITYDQITDQPSDKAALDFTLNNTPGLT